MNKKINMSLLSLTCAVRYADNAICTTLYTMMRFFKLYGSRLAIYAGPQDLTNLWYRYIMIMMGSGFDTRGKLFVRGSERKTDNILIKLNIQLND